MKVGDIVKFTGNIDKEYLLNCYPGINFDNFYKIDYLFVFK